ncbi:MAG TPA: lamin tail domain-containing protein [Gemmatimonadaceae bacterium]
MINTRTISTAVAVLLFGSAVITACTDGGPSDMTAPIVTMNREHVMLNCTASRASLTVTCGTSSPEGVRSDLIGSQNVMVKLTSSNVSYDSGTQIFAFDLTVQNLLNETVGTPGGSLPDPDGIQVFFNSGPTVTSGTGSISVANADGVAAFTSGAQPYFAYHEILAANQVSSAHTWQLSMPPTVNTFSFTLLLEMDWEPKLVINEILANPVAATIPEEQPAEWVELYNAGSKSVDLQGLVIADSAASGRRPYHTISSSLIVQPGGYVVLGGSTNTVDNKGATVDYSYGTSISLANSLDAFKIARVVGEDTVTIDRTQYSNASVSAKDGISRELKNPSLDNSNMDGSNWGDASVTSVYGSGGRGTPKAQNSSFTPSGNLLIPARLVPDTR